MPESSLKKAAHTLVVKLNDASLDLRSGTAQRTLDELIVAALDAQQDGVRTGIQVANRLESVKKDWSNDHITFGELRSYVRYEAAMLADDPLNQKGH